MPDLCRRLAAHLRGTRVSYEDVEVDESGLSAFGRDLLAAARSLAWGEVVTYGGLAALAGRPRAARAAGSFCAGNRLSLVVPCHRIVAAGHGEPFSLGELRPRRPLAQAPPARARGDAALSEGRLSADARAELASLSAGAPVRPARRALGALPHGRHGPPPRPGRALVPPRPGGVGRRAAGVRDPPAAAGRVADPHLPAARVRSGVPDAAARRRNVTRDRRPAGSGRPRPRAAAARPAARQGRRARRAAARRTSAGRSSAQARSAGRGRRTSRCGRRSTRAPPSSAASRRPPGCACG